MKTEQTVTNQNTETMALHVGKARSLLPNSSPEILRPLRGLGGTFHVVWIEQIDAHCLFFNRDGEDASTMLATHHNGYSCHALAERIISGDRKRINDQLEYIRRCAGTAIAEGFCL